MKIIYLHGFNSDKNSLTIRNLRTYYPDAVGFSYDYINPDKGFEQIKSVIEETLKTDTNVILVGSSLGGFWANYFGQKYNVKAVLLNPSIKPSETLKRYLGETKNYNSGETFTLTVDNLDEYKKYEVETKPGYFRYIVLGMKDDVLDYRQSAQHFKDKGKITYINEGHRISFPECLEAVREASNYFPE